MSTLDELKKRERELLYQLEYNGKENYRTKELIETFEGYDRASHRYQSDCGRQPIRADMQDSWKKRSCKETNSKTKSLRTSPTTWMI